MIRQAKTEDAAILTSLAIQLWPDHDPHGLTEEFRKLLKNDDDACFLKYVDGMPIAFAHCRLRHDYVEGTDSSPAGYLEGVFVTEEYCRKGYAAQLLAACEQWAKEKGCTEFAGDCKLDNDESFRFHMSMGFTETNRIICFKKRLQLYTVHKKSEREYQVWAYRFSARKKAPTPGRRSASLRSAA